MGIVGSPGGSRHYKGGSGGKGESGSQETVTVLVGVAQNGQGLVAQGSLVRGFSMVQAKKKEPQPNSFAPGKSLKKCYLLHPPHLEVSNLA